MTLTACRPPGWADEDKRDAEVPAFRGVGGVKRNAITRNDAGTTMIELVIAAAVFTAGAVTLLGGLMTLMTHSRVADERARATNYARSTFEDMRGRTINQILTYNVPVDNAQQGTVTMPGSGTATVGAFAIIPNGQGGFTSFQLGKDDPATLNVGALPNPIEIRLVVTPVHGGTGGSTQMHFASTTMLPY